MTESSLHLVEQISRGLLAQKLFLATAESCTGGALAASLTALAGASHWFERGFVVYSNLAKQQELAVDPQVIETQGAVSAATASRMAEGTLRHSAADIAIATTGIAGPGGATAKKPVGTVFIALAKRGGKTEVWQQHFPGSRQQVCEQTVQFALQRLVEQLTA